MIKYHGSMDLILKPHSKEKRIEIKSNLIKHFLI